MDRGLSTLCDVLNASDDDDLGFSLRRAEWIDHDVRLTGQVIDSGERGAVWEITCRDVLGYTAGPPAWGTVTVLEDQHHPLLRQYLDPVMPLYYRGRTTHLTALVGELWLAHRDACGDWVSFGGVSAATLGVGYGKLTEGPRFVIDAYRAVLDRHGLDPHSLEGRPFVRYRGSDWVRLERAPIGLVIGSTRVVATELAAVCATM